MDIVLVGGIELIHDSIKPQIGPLIVNKILSTKFNTKFIDFDYLTYTGAIEYSSSIEKNINLYVSYIMNFNPKIVGFYTMCNSFDFVLRISEKIKKINSNIKIFYGGPHATLNASECMVKFDFLDAIILGEAEKSILPVVEKLMKKEIPYGINGVVYRDGEKVNNNGFNDLLSKEEMPTFLLEDYDIYEFEEGDIIYIEGGRGCPYSCTFCSTSLFWGRKHRVIDPVILVDHINKLKIKYNVNNFSIIHDHFTANPEYIKKFCNEILSRNINIIWSCSARVNDLGKEILSLMKKSGCYSIYVGLETGSPKMQTTINKNIKLDEAFFKINEIKKLGIDITISLIYGFPDETIDDLKETIKYIEKLYLSDIYNIQLHFFKAYSKTIEFEKVKNIMYFNDDVRNYSLYEDKYFDSKTKEMILKYPELFVSYYTFDTEVRNKFSTLDTFIFIISVSFNVYQESLKYLIKSKGLLNIYDDFRNFIDGLHIDKKSFKQRTNLENNYRFLQYVQNYLEKQIYDSTNIKIIKMFEYEKILCTFLISEKDKEYVFLDYNIKDLLSGDTYTYNETCYMLSRKKDKVNVSIVPLGLGKFVASYEKRIH